MKRAFLILILLAAFNIFQPNSQALNQTPHHKIEFTEEDKSRDLTNNVIIRNKVILYMKLNVLLARVVMINNSNGFNTS